MDITLDKKPPEFFIVKGTNWVCEVQLDYENTQLPLMMRVEEAATKVIEQIKGINHNLILKLETGETEPELGGTVSVQIKDSNDEEIMLMVFELLANGGFYKDSILVAQQTQQALKEIYDAQQALIEEVEKVKKVKKPRKPRKPKNPEE